MLAASISVSCLAAFQEQPPGACARKRSGQLEQTRQRRERAGADHVRPKAVSAFAELFNAHGVDVHRRTGLARDLGEERAFLAVAFDQMHAEIRLPGLKDGDDESGKACP